MQSITNILQASQEMCHLPTGFEIVGAHSPVRHSGPIMGGHVSSTSADTPTEHPDNCGTLSSCDL
jgi:hypothetical protein